MGGRRRWTKSFAAGACVAAGLCPRTALAQTPPEGDEPVIEWIAPAGCPRATEVLDAILSAGAPPEAVAALHPRARVKRSGNAWHVAIAVTTPRGSARRHIAAESCAALAQATALVLALAAQPELAPDDDAPPAPPPSRPPAPRWNVGLALAGFVDLGTVAPSVVPGLEWVASVGHDRIAPVRVEVTGGLSAIASTGAGVGRAQLRLRFLAASVCGVTRGRIEAGGCVEVEREFLEIDSLLLGLPATLAWWTPRLRGTVAYRLEGGWAVRADIAFGTGVDAPAIVVQKGQDTLAIEPPATWSGRATIGVTARF